MWLFSPQFSGHKFSFLWTKRLNKSQMSNSWAEAVMECTELSHNTSKPNLASDSKQDLGGKARKSRDAKNKQGNHRLHYCAKNKKKMTWIFCTQRDKVRCCGQTEVLENLWDVRSPSERSLCVTVGGESQTCTTYISTWSAINGLKWCCGAILGILCSI